MLLQEHSNRPNHLCGPLCIDLPFLPFERPNFNVQLIATTKKGQGELHLTDIYLELAMNCMHIPKFFAYFYVVIL